MINNLLHAVEIALLVFVILQGDDATGKLKLMFQYLTQRTAPLFPSEKGSKKA